MTIEEAAATLGLTSHEVCPERVERNYRLKAKHCHPDRASYPGAAAEFKRATEAFNRLKTAAERPTETLDSQASSELAVAAKTFVFCTAYSKFELYPQLSCSDWIGKLAGMHALRLQEAGTVRKGDPLAELWTGRVNAPRRPILIAPVDVEIIDVKGRFLCHAWVLRPLETEQVERQLASYLAAGSDLKSAVEWLRLLLSGAARSPINV